MQFSTVAFVAASVALVNAATVTETDSSSTLVTITDCDSTVTDCPAHSTSAAPVNSTAPSNVTTYEGAALRNQFGAGVAALAAGALLAFIVEMGDSEETRAFQAAVLAVVQHVPHGRVTSYGHIAYLVQRPQNARQVGSTLKHSKLIVEQLNSGSVGDGIDYNMLCWWRVLSSSGKISPRGDSHSEFLQADKLRAEGVVVSEAFLVDLELYGWFPDEVDY